MIGPHAARLPGGEGQSPHTAAVVRLTRQRKPIRCGRLPKGDLRFLYRQRLGL